MSLRRSANITLVVVASVALVSCSRENESRLQYRTMQACAIDWGSDNLCDYDDGFYWGPFYKYQKGKYHYRSKHSKTYQVLVYERPSSQKIQQGKAQFAPAGGVSQKQMGSGINTVKPALEKQTSVSKPSQTVARGGFGASSRSSSS